MKNEEIKNIDIIEFEFDNENNNVKELHTKKTCIQLNLKNQNPIVILDIPQEEFIKHIGKCEYKFRKGIGIKGEIQRLKFIKKVNNKVSLFHPYRKKNNGHKLYVDRSKKIQLEIKYIYPYILSPHLTDKGLKWNEDKTYVIFPYVEGEKQPITKDKLEKESPLLFNYLKQNRDKLIKQSSYNQRVQNTQEFYGVIRVGLYTYSDCFVAIRDNTRLNPCIVRKIKTDWGEEKIPLFDGHISYISQRPDGKFINCEEARYIWKRLKESEHIILKIFNSRSISSRLPVKLPIYEKEKEK